MDLRLIVLLVCLRVLQAKIMHLSCKQIRELVDGHNLRRLQLTRGDVPGQPPAAQMKTMMWDEELASKARKWASREQYMHNPDKTIETKRFRTGENLYMFSTTNKGHFIRLNASMDAWWTEFKDYSYHALNARDFAGDVVVGHYTQMAWSSTMFLGCALSRFSEGKWERFLVVCNYGPAGNMLGETPYPSGPPANGLTCPIRECTMIYGDRC